MNKNKGFTLVELLIVVGILAVLSTATVLILNPADILKETRDSQRLNDMANITSAIAVYLATATTPAITAETNCTVGIVTYESPATACTTDNTRAVDGTGWVAVNLGSKPALTTLPLDPLQTPASYYIFAGDATNTTFELNTKLESTRYSALYHSPDGGDNTAVYEVGTDPGLNLL